MPLGFAVNIVNGATNTQNAWAGAFQGDIAHVCGGVNAGNIFGNTGTFVQNIRGWRVDRQPPPANMANIQIQRNGVVNVPSSIAAVLVPTALQAHLGALAHHNPIIATRNNARHKELSHKVRQALIASANSRVPPANQGAAHQITIYVITGMFSA